MFRTSTSRAAGGLKQVMSASLHTVQAPTGPHLLPESLMDSGDLFTTSLLTQGAAPARQQPLPPTNPAATSHYVLLDKLFTSLEVLRGAKATGGVNASTPSSLDASGRQSPLEGALLEHLTQLDLGANSPTGPLSREESTASISSTGTAPTSQPAAPASHVAAPLSHAAVSHAAAGHLSHAATPAPAAYTPASHVVMHAPTVTGVVVAPPPQPATHQQQLLSQLQAQQHFAPACTTSAVMALAAQLAGAAAFNMHPAPAKGAPQVQQYLQTPHQYSIAAAIPPAHMALYLQQQQQQQWLHQQWLLAQQHQQWHQPEECLIGLAGQYQSYCCQVISEEMNVLGHCLLAKLKMLQQSDSDQGEHSKRFFCSIKEVSKVVHRAKCIIVAPDVKPNPAAHINPVKMLGQVLRCAELNNVPIIFALSRRGIGQVFGRDKSMSIVAVLSTDQCEPEYAAMLHLAQQGRELFHMHRAYATSFPQRM